MAAFNEHLRDFAGRLIVHRLHLYAHFGIQLCKSVLAFGLLALYGQHCIGPFGKVLVCGQLAVQVYFQAFVIGDTQKLGDGIFTHLGIFYDLVEQ